MAYVSYLHQGIGHVGELTGSHVVPLKDLTELGRDSSVEALANAARETSAAVDIDDVTVLPVVPNPSKVICIGLNYRDHVIETNRDMPTYPVMFPKYSSSLIGARDDIMLPPESTQVDYEGELAVVIGRRGRRIDEADAVNHILGYTVANDVTMRDFQYKTHQWMQGKAWDRSTPIGPYLVTQGEVDISDAGIRTILNGEKVQESHLSQLIFTVPNLIATISTFLTLEPGDLILTGTPGGVGYRRKPQRMLTDGDQITVEIDGIGATQNRVRR